MAGILVVPLYTLVLANLHGGFLSLPLIVATATLGHALSGTCDLARRRNLVKFGLGFRGLVRPCRRPGESLMGSGCIATSAIC